MAPSNAEGPATENGKPALKDDLCSPAKIDPNNNPSASTSQAPDDAGDLAYFSARPNERHRIRLPFPNEFPAKLLKHPGGGTAMVVVVVQRDESGRPTRRARGISFIDGGHA